MRVNKSGCGGAVATAAAAVPVPSPYPFIGHFAPGYDTVEASARIKREGRKGPNFLSLAHADATVGIMVGYYHWTDLHIVPNGNVVHLRASCAALTRAHAASRRLTSAEYGITYHNTRVCNLCIRKDHRGIPSSLRGVRRR